MQIRGRKAENLQCFRDFIFLALEQFFPQLVRNIMVTDYFFVYSYFFQCVRKKIEKNFWDMEIIGNRRKIPFLVTFSDLRLQKTFELQSLKRNNPKLVSFN